MEPLKDGALERSGEEGLAPRAAVINGRLVIKHPPGGPYPVIAPCPGLRLVVNGEERKEPTPVSDKDKVEIIVLDEQREGYWQVKVSEDKLKAFLHVKPWVLVRREMRDVPPARFLNLQVLEQEDFYKAFTMEDLTREMERQGIRYGIDWQACGRGLEPSTEGTLIIAQGIPPVPGKDASVEIFFTTQPKVPVAVGEEETVDFRERFHFTAVEAGMVLARKHPAGAGQPGQTVTGELILPPEPKDIQMIAGSGAVLRNDGLEVIAAMAGRPVVRRLKGRVIISVLPALMHPSNVDITSGNISFSGDVIIAGQVEEGMRVEAGGNINIAGAVSGAAIRAGGCIEVRGNVFSSLLVAGSSTVWQEKFLSILGRIGAMLEHLTTAITQLLHHPSFKKDDLKGGVGPLVLLLLERKFRDLPAAVKILEKELQTFPAISTDGLTALVKDLERLVRTPLAVKSVEQLEAIMKGIRICREEINTPPQDTADIIINYAVNSTVIATGNIKVMGNGCYHTRLQAGRTVTVGGVFRGGEIQAQGDVYIKELGSRTGTSTGVETGSAATVTIGHAFENTSVRIGPRRYYFVQEEWGVRLRLDREGNIIKSSIPL
ncbi:MAG: DUF342 domain-containing protein [Thermoanaerobacteraceae bacterium]|nr:DUF342 domain-containing protein [Thermoanaerobacteraceae bacterium]